MLRASILLLTGAWLAGCSEPPGPRTCNGSAALCARRLDQVAFAVAHNAMSAADEGWDVPNQHHGLARALAAGVRGLMLDVHDDAGVAHLCHGLCALGKKPLVEGLGEVRAFLDANPHEVVALGLEPYVGVDAIEAALRDSGLLGFARAQAAGEPWPTLGELVDRGERLLVFTESGGGARPWYLEQYRFFAETPYSFKSAAEMGCGPHRGDETNGLFLVNHFVTNPFADENAAAEVNRNPFLVERVRRCLQERRRATANWIAVDFWDVGDLLATVRELNGT